MCAEEARRARPARAERWGHRVNTIAAVLAAYERHFNRCLRRKQPKLARWYWEQRRRVRELFGQ